MTRTRPTNEADKQWAKAVKERDDYTCRVCGLRDTGAGMHAHHVKPWSKYPGLRYDVDNGVALCRQHNLEMGNKEVVRLSYKDESWYPPGVGGGGTP